MGGSSSGPAESEADTRELQRELASLRDPNSQQAQAIKGLLSGRMSDEEAVAQRQALAAINQGTQGAVQGAREDASARGLFSSDIGLGLEIGAQQQLSGQRAGIFQQRAQNVQQGMLQGIQASQANASLRSGLAGQISSLRTNVGMANAQMQQQYNQSQQSFGAGLAGTAGKLALGFATGGTSEAFGAASKVFG